MVAAVVCYLMLGMQVVLSQVFKTLEIEFDSLCPCQQNTVALNNSNPFILYSVKTLLLPYNVNSPSQIIKVQTMAEKLPHCGNISARVKELEASGVTRTAIFDSIQSFQNAPRSMKTFYKLYRQDMDEVHAENVRQIGGKVVEQAKEGDFKSQEFYLRSKGGWSPQHTEVIVEDDKEDTSALDKLMTLLGKQ